MKKIIIILLLVVLFASCKKETNYKCYRCEFYDATNSGVVRPPERVCTDKLPDAFYDSNGNEMSFICRDF